MHVYTQSAFLRVAVEFADWDLKKKNHTPPSSYVPKDLYAETCQLQS